MRKKSNSHLEKKERPSKENKVNRRHQEQELDKSLKDTFPASDATAKY